MNMKSFMSELRDEFQKGIQEGAVKEARKQGIRGETIEEITKNIVNQFARKNSVGSSNVDLKELVELQEETNDHLLAIKEELINSRKFGERQARAAEEQRLESSGNKQIALLERIATLLDAGDVERVDLGSLQGGMSKIGSPLGMLVGLISSLGFVGKILEPIGKLLTGNLGASGGLVRLFSKVVGPINAIFSLFEGIADFFDTSGISEKLDKSAEEITVLDRVMNGLVGFVARFVGNIVDPILKLLNIDFSTEEFIENQGAAFQNLVDETYNSVLNWMSGLFDSVLGLFNEVTEKGVVGYVTELFDGFVDSITGSIGKVIDYVVESIADAADAVLDWVKTRPWIPDFISESLPETERGKQREMKLHNERQFAAKEQGKNELPSAQQEVKNIEARLKAELEVAAKKRDAGVGQPSEVRERYDQEYQREVQSITTRYDKEYAEAKQRVEQLTKQSNIELPHQTIGSNVTDMMNSGVSLQKVGSMKTSQQGLDFIKQREAFRSEAYQDVGGIWTIGYGTTMIDGRPVKPGMKITKEEALRLKAKDIEQFENVVNKAVTVPLSQNEFDALVSLAYNIGGGAFSKSTLVKKLNAGDREGAKQEFMKWNKVSGKEVTGLSNRRGMEAEMFAGGDSSLIPQVSNSDVASVSPTKDSGSLLMSGAKNQAETKTEIAQAPVQVQTINNPSASSASEELSIALRNSEPSFQKVIERLALSSFGVVGSPVMTA